MTFKDRLTYLLIHEFAIAWYVRAREIFRVIKPAALILEIGCGWGTWTTALHHFGKRWVAFDIQHNRPVHTRKLTEHDHENKVMCLQASGSELPFKQQMFDLVVCFDVIEHIPDDQQVAQEIARVVKPGGHAIVTTMLDDRPVYLRKFVFDDHLREYDPEVFAALFRQAGMVEQQRFFFYRVASTISRELQDIVCPRTDKIPLVGVAIRLMLGAFAHLDALLPFGRPSGVGLVMERPTSV